MKKATLRQESSPNTPPNYTNIIAAPSVRQFASDTFTASYGWLGTARAVMTRRSFRKYLEKYDKLSKAEASEVAALVLGELSK
jgi:hypothetical protein